MKNIRVKDAEWLRAESNGAVNDFFWRLEKTPKVDWPLTEGQIRARIDAGLFDFLNKCRLYLDENFKGSAGSNAMALDYRRMIQILTEATINAAGPEERPIQHNKANNKKRINGWKNPVYKQIACGRRR